MTQYPQQPPPGQYGPPPPKKKHTARNVVLVLLGLCVLGVGGCMALVVGAGNEVNKQANEEHVVVYRVAGTSSAASLITYTTSGAGTTEQFSNAALPWAKSFSIKGLAPVYQVMAQNRSDQTGTVTCSIEVDGKVVDTATGDGASTIAHCTYAP